MLISEILNWNNDPAEKVRPGPQPDLSSAPFNDDPTNLANAFTRRGLVKSFWNLNGWEGQPTGPAPLDPEPELSPSGTLEPSAASWQTEPVETERPVDQHPLDPLARYRGVYTTRLAHFTES